MPERYDHRRVFGESLHRLLHAYQRALRDAHRRHGLDLSVGQIRVLKGAYFLDAATVQRIAEFTALDRGQVTRIVSGLRRDELISTRANPRDGRIPIIECTAAGEAMIEPIMAIQRDAGDCMAAGLSDTAVDRFVAMADAMTTNLTTASHDHADGPSHER